MTTEKHAFTVERAYLLPVYQHVTVEAATPEEAARLAIDLDDWESSEKDYDNSRAIYIDGIWSGEDSAYEGEQHAVPRDLQNPERLNADTLRDLVAAIESARASWAERQAPAGEDNENRDQEEADSVVDALDALLAIASSPEFAEVEEPTASPPPAETIAGMEEALGGPQATPERVAAVEDRLANEPAEEFDPIAFELRSGRPLSDEAKRTLRDRAREEAGVGSTELARIRRDAQNIAHRMAHESAKRSAWKAGDLDAIDSRVDLLLRNVDNLANALDRLAAIAEAR